MQTIPLTDVKVKQQFSYSNDSTAKNQEIHQYFVTRNYKACMSTIEQQLKKYDNNSEYALYVKGLILRQQGKVQESLTVFQTVADLNPVSIDNIKQVAKTYMLLGRYKEAVDNFDEALSLTQDPDWECLHNKAMCLQQLGNDEQAIETYLQAIEADPQQVTLCALGNIYSQLERYSEALPMYEHALTLSPENSELLTIVGLICLRMGDHDKAFEKLGSALTIDPRNSKTILAAGMIIQDKGDTDVALAKYRIAAAHSEFAELWNNIGMCFYSKQKIQAAISCLLKARSMAQFDWRIAYNLGILYLETEQFDNHLKFLSES
ncbi:putative BBS4 protein [Monocercomonoides exilis]|uniref:putative BBS4 protein n=1 Tax=Monocercomonoides exilis TaxID=2049356 RepID=UPI00355AB379|nr:putative BBS4 protein [Monocercomonoides exilis]